MSAAIARYIGPCDACLGEYEPRILCGHVAACVQCAAMLGRLAEVAKRPASRHPRATAFEERMPEDDGATAGD